MGTHYPWLVSVHCPCNIPPRLKSTQPMRGEYSGSLTNQRQGQLPTSLMPPRLKQQGVSCLINSLKCRGNVTNSEVINMSWPWWWLRSKHIKPFKPFMQFLNNTFHLLFHLAAIQSYLARIDLILKSVDFLQKWICAFLSVNIWYADHSIGQLRS